METVPIACAHDHGPGGSSTAEFPQLERLANLEREFANLRTAVCDTRALVNDLIARSAGVPE